jgi:hypothetical protein
MAPSRGSPRPIRAATLPRRDADGRVVSLPELLGVAAGYAVVNGVGLVLLDALLAVVGLSSFGRASGWLVLILPALLYFDDFRGWRAYRLRWLAAPVAALVAIAIGMLGAGLARELGPLGSGAVGGLVALLAYAPIWFVGIRLLTAVPTEDP